MCLYLRALAPEAPWSTGVLVLSSYTEKIFLGLHVDLVLSVISRIVLKQGRDIYKKCYSIEFCKYIFMAAKSSCTSSMEYLPLCQLHCYMNVH